ncbi:MAG TPA: alpha/beta fold hydrolase [Caulobacteraceae bacterium]|jgi:dienelactone hydrolase
MGKRLALLAIGWLLVLGGGFFAHLVQTSGGVTVQDVRYPGDAGETLSALLYTPPGADAAHPAPAVLISHGFINTREMQSPFAIELARRGFVVLAMDMTGHGYSGGAMGVDGFGGPASLKYLQSLPMVDKANIGLEGHSMGGAPVMNAVTADPTGYRSVVLEGTTTQFFGAGAPATPAFPRNLEVVFGQYDEFAPLMWQQATGANVASSPKLEKIFDAKGPVTVGKLYGSAAEGTARRLVNPPVDHPQEHFSNAGVGAAIDWFQLTLKGAASPKPAADQVWFGKEIGTLISLVGGVAVILGTFQLGLAAPGFRRLSQDPTIKEKPAPHAPRRSRSVAFALTAAIPALTFYPLMKVAPAVFFAPFAVTGTLPFSLATFPEQIADQLVVWALGAGLISFAVSFVLGEKTVITHRWLAAAGLAIVSVGMGYLSLVVVDLVFKTDFRFWVVGLKPLDARHAGLFLVYLAPFTLFSLLALRGYGPGLAVKGEGALGACLAGAAAFCGGFAVLLGAQYVHMASTGLLLTPDEPLNTIIAFQFVPILAVVGIIAAFTWRLTGDYVPGAFVCALFLTWYIVAGTAIFPPSLNALAPPAAKSATPSAARVPAPAAPTRKR